MKSLVVSIHDVSPLTRLVVEKILGELSELGVARRSLLVIPNHHGRAPMLEDADFCRWLKGGDEVVMHGYFHQRGRREKESVLDQWTTQIYTAGEGEFYDIGEKEAFELVERAAAEFQQIGLSPRGFIAPAWLLSDAGENALRRFGCDYTTRLGTVVDLQRNHTTKSQSLVYSVRTLLRKKISLAWNRFLFSRLTANPLLRVSIHPVDFQHDDVWKQIRAFITAALEDRVAVTYHQWILAQRGG